MSERARREPTHIPCCWGSLYEKSGCTCPTPRNLAMWAKRDAHEKAKQERRDARTERRLAKLAAKGRPDLRLVG